MNPMSEWVEAEFGRRLFANLWEAYAGGLVIDVSSRRHIADDALRRTLALMEIVRVEPAEVRVERARGVIKFRASGGGLMFVTTVWLEHQGLQGLRPTRVDGLIPSPIESYLRSRGIEVV